jgi:hypothetical protein
VRVGATRVARLDIQIFCGDVKERVIDENRQILDLELDEGTYQRYLTSGIPFSTRVAFNGDPVHVKISSTTSPRT